MRLRRKTILTVAAILSIMTIVIVAVASNLVMESALSQEKHEVEQDLDRALAAIASLEDEMERINHDWAGWNDTYLFAQDFNEHYIETNLHDSTLATLKLNCFLFFDNSLQLTYGIGYDYDAEERVLVSNGTIDMIAKGLQTVKLLGPEDSMSGLVLTDEGVLLLSVHTITDSTLTAPVVGSLVMARYLDPARMVELSSEVKVNTALFSANDPTGSGIDLSTWNQMIESKAAHQVPIDDRSIVAYQVIQGIDGSAAGVVKIEGPRATVTQASSAINLLTSTLVLVSLAFCLVTLVITDRFTMRRVESLSRQVSDLGLKGDMSYRIAMDGSDELSDLADEVNKTLDAIVTMENELRESERRYRAIVNDQTEMIFRLLDEGTITFANDAMLKELRRESKDVIGRHINDVLPLSIVSSLLAQCEEARKTGRVVVRDLRYFSRTENREKWYSWSVREIASRGDTKEFQGVGRDLTEQKFAEESLGQANKKLNLMASVTRHDVMNQLTVAHGFVSISKLQTSDPKLIEQLTKAEVALRSIQGHLEFTRDYQRTGLAQPVWIPLEKSLEKAAAGPRANGIAVSTAVQDYEIFTDPLVEKVFYNLLDNAQRHGGGVKEIKVTCRSQDGDLFVEFQDDGRGVLDEEKEQIFQAGYGNNTGYGLFLAREILGATGMTIRETGRPGQGAVFEIRVPPGKFRRIPIAG